MVLPGISSLSHSTWNTAKQFSKMKKMMFPLLRATFVAMIYIATYVAGDAPLVFQARSVGSSVEDVGWRAYLRIPFYPTHRHHWGFQSNAWDIHFRKTSSGARCASSSGEWRRRTMPDQH
jgi:hypothetical protein